MQKREGRSFAAPPTTPVLPDLGRTGRKGLPPVAALPPLTSALSRRAALFGAVTVAGVTAAAAVPTIAQAAPLSANDRRLVELADAYEALDRRCNAHTAANRHLRGEAMKAADDEFDDLTSGFGPLEEECAETPADTMAGVMAKARLCRSPTARGCAGYDHITSVVDDLLRVLGTGALS